MNACKELEGFNMVKSQISELDRLIFILTNKRGKAKALKAAQALPWSYIEGCIESNRDMVSDFLENGMYSIENSTVEISYPISDDDRFKIQNSFDWTLHELLNGAFPVKRNPVHNRKNVKRIESMYKFHHGVELDWQLAAKHFPEFFPSTKVAPKRPKGAVYKHATKRGRWVGEDMIVLPMLFKLKVLRDEAVSFYIKFEMKLARKQSEGTEGFSNAFYPSIVVSDDVLKEKLAAQGGTIPEVFLQTTLVIGESGVPVEPVEPIRFYQGVNELTGN